MKPAILVFAITFLASVAMAQQRPPLVQEIRVTASDSALVRLAKRTVAARRGGPSSLVINDRTVTTSHGVLTVGADIQYPEYTAPTVGTAAPRIETESAFAPVHKGPTSEELAARRASLTAERERMAAQYLEGEYTDLPEDLIDARIGQIPGEIQETRGNPPPNP